MYRILLLLIIWCIAQTISYSQNEEKLIENQSLLIEGLKEVQIGNKDKAIEIFEKLKFENTFKAVSYFQLAKIHKSNDKIEEAIEAINQSILVEPENSWYIIFKISLTEFIGKYPETADSYEKLSTIEPNNFSHYDNAAFYYSKADDFKKALEILNKSEQKFGILPAIAIKKSYVLGFLKKNKNAIEVLENSYRQFPNNKELLVELIKALIDLNKKNESNFYIKKLQEHDPNAEELKLWTSQPESNNSIDQEVELIKLIQSPEAGLDDKIKLLFSRLNEFVKKSDLQGIKTLILPAENLRKQFPNQSKTSALMGDLHFQLNDLLKARESYIQSIREGSVPYSVWDNLLFCLIHLNHWKTASHFSEKCIDLYPNQSFPSYVFILSKFKQNQLDGIVNIIDQLEIIVNHNEHKKTEVLILKAKILSALQLEKESMEAWKNAIEVDRDHLANLEYCTFMASIGSSYPKEYFEKAMSSEFIHESFKLNKAAELYYYTKDFKKAKDFIDKSMSKDYSESFETIDLAAKIYEALGDIKKTEEFKTKAKYLLDSEHFEKVQQN